MHKGLARFAGTVRAQEHCMFPYRIPTFWGCPASQKHQEDKKRSCTTFYYKTVKKVIQCNKVLQNIRSAIKLPVLLS